MAKKLFNLRKNGRCTVCTKKIKIQIFKGTGFCSKECKKAAGHDVSSVGIYMHVTNEERDMIGEHRGE